MNFKLTITLALALLFQFGTGQTTINSCGDSRTIVHSIKTSIDTLIFCASDPLTKDSLIKGTIQAFLNQRILTSRFGEIHPVKGFFSTDKAVIVQYAIAFDLKLKRYYEIPGLKYSFWVKGDSVRFSRQFLYNHPTLTKTEIDSVTNYFYNISKKTNFTKLKDKIIMLFYCCLNDDKKAQNFWKTLNEFFTKETYLKEVYGGEPAELYLELDWWWKSLRYKNSTAVTY